MPLQVQITQQDTHLTAASVRQHTVYTDKSQDNGGNDTGPSARELFLMSVGSCFMKNLHAAVISRDAEVSDVLVDVVGHQGGHPNRFERIELRVTANYSDQATMHRLVTIAERGCTLTNTLRHAVDITVSVARLNGQQRAVS